MTTAFDVRKLIQSDDRDAFDCDVAPLNRYLREQAGQDMRRRLCNCFVAIDFGSGNIGGYYTISSGSIALDHLPIDITRRLPRYSAVPAVLLGRLAVDRRFRNIGLGRALLHDAILRSLDAAPAAFALVVDAKDDEAAAFYVKHQFIVLGQQPLRLFLPMATAAKLIA